MKFGIHNSSWLDAPDPAEAFEAVNAKAQWAEGHGFVGTVSEAITETRELFASDVMPHFA